jgi:hypothetical protein
VNNVIPSALKVKSIVLSLTNISPKKCIYMMLIADAHVGVVHG